MQSQSMHLVLSTDAKPRLKWTPELHQRFIEAINQLGGAESEYSTSLVTLLFLRLYYIDHILGLMYFFSNCACGRSNSKESFEGDGDSGTHFVPPQEPFTGISLFVMMVS